MFSLQDITSQNLHDIVLNSIFSLMFSLQDITSQNLHEIVKLYFPSCSVFKISLRKN